MAECLYRVITDIYQEVLNQCVGGIKNIYKFFFSVCECDKQQKKLLTDSQQISFFALKIKKICGGQKYFNYLRCNKSVMPASNLQKKKQLL